MTLSELRKLAQSATSGNWNYEYERYSARCVIGVKPVDDRWIAHCQPELNGDNNAKFIAAMNPATALRMIELLERAKKELELMCAYFEHDRQVVLHKNDIVPDSKKWLKDLEDL